MTAPAFVGRLESAGLTPESVAARANQLARVVERVSRHPERRPHGRRLQAAAGDDVAWWHVPGRIEVLGKHTDYAGGRSLLAATDQGFAIAAVRRDDAVVAVTDETTGDRLVLSPGHEHGQLSLPWGTYARAVVNRVGRNFPAATRGVEIAFASDLPPAAGLSSSSALVVGLFLAIGWANELERQPAYVENIATREDLAAYLATIENGLGFGSLAGERGVGTFGGSEDHTAILCSRAGHLRQYGFCPTRLEREVSLPADVVFVVASSGVVAEKTGAAREAYNRVSAIASRLVETWNQATGQHRGSLADACAASPDAVARLASLASRGAASADEARLRSNRLAQFVAETYDIVPSAADALGRGDWVAFREQVDRSQELAEQCLGNQVPETIWLAREARPLGARAASAFGAGFGGSVWALVDRADAVRFLDAWTRGYRHRFPARADAAVFFLSGAGPPALDGIMKRS